MKNLKKWTKAFALITVASVFTVACDSEEGIPAPAPIDPVASTNAIWVANQGNFKGIGRLDVYYPDSSKYVPGVYKTANGESLPGNIQSLSWFGNEAFLAINNLDAILVLNENLVEIDRIVNSDWLVSPRYFAQNDDYVFVSVWGPYNNDFTDLPSSTIAVLDKKTRSLVKEVSVEAGPEQLAIVGNNLWVSHDTWVSQQLTVIDISELSVTKEIPLVNGSDVVATGSKNDVWAKDGTTILRFDNASEEKLKTYELNQTVDHMYFKGNSLYFSTVTAANQSSIYEIDTESNIDEYFARLTADRFYTFLLQDAPGAQTKFFQAIAPINLPGKLIEFSASNGTMQYDTDIHPYQLVQKPF